MRRKSKITCRRLSRIFSGMKQRCLNSNDTSYRLYGARNVQVCQEWLDDPKSFEEWSFDNGYRKDLTIDRINPDSNYCPENCRWIPLSDNAKWHRGVLRIWIGCYVNTQQGWSLLVGKSKTWFSQNKLQHGQDYAYQKLLDRIEKLGGIKKIMNVPEEEPDISKFLTDIENDCLEEVDL